MTVSIVIHLRNCHANLRLLTICVSCNQGSSNPHDLGTSDKVQRIRITGWRISWWEMGLPVSHHKHRVIREQSSRCWKPLRGKSRFESYHLTRVLSLAGGTCLIHLNTFYWAPDAQPLSETFGSEFKRGSELPRSLN